MRIEPVKKLLGNRIILAALAVAGSLIGASLLQARGVETSGIVWQTTAVYMLGVLIAALLMMPLVEEKGWLWITAVLMAVTIIFPGAVLNTDQWIATQLQQLGSAANTLFFVLMISMVEQPNQNAGKKWVITCAYVLIMLLLTFLL